MHHRTLFLLATLLAVLPVTAQDAVDAAATTAITSPVVYQDIAITIGATTVLIFPVAICENCIDRGHPDLSTSEVPGVSNVLRVKAFSETMPQTNLTVFTTDGMIYSFTVRYQSAPTTFIYDFTRMAQNGPARFTAGRLTPADIASSALIAAATAPRRHRPVTRSVGGMELRLQNIFLKEGIMFLSFAVRNNSSIDYDVDFTRFYVRDRKRRKRTSMMEKLAQPIHQLISPKATVAAGGSATIVVAFPKFTIAAQKLFCTEIFEQNGDRVLQLRLSGRHLLKAHAF